VDAGAGTGELGAALATRRLLEEQQVRRMAPIRQPRAAAAIGPNKQARAVHHHSDRPAPVFRAAGALVCLGRWLHRVPHDKSITDTLILERLVE
jgi:hypothetical protein